MPKEPMKSRVIRVSDDLWAAAKARADERGETVSVAVRKFLERYAMSEVTLSGGDLDGMTYVIKPGITTVWAVNEPSPGRLERVAYEESPADPEVWVMRVLSQEEIDEAAAEDD